LFSSLLKVLKAEVKSPVIARLQEEMLSSCILRLNFLFTKCSMKRMVEVMSHISEFTHPPFVQGEAMTMGTLYPRPTGPAVAYLGSTPDAISCSLVTYSVVQSKSGVVFPVDSSFGFGATNGGT